MRKGTLKLVMAASGVYYAIFFLESVFLPADLTLPVYFLVGPLLVFVLLLANDLSRRAAVPTEAQVRNPPSRTLSREVQQLSRQIEVGADSSPSYFENILLVKLREILVERVALETGTDQGGVREVLANPRQGPGLLRNDQLYRLLYSPPQARGPARVKLLEDAIALIEGWKP